MFPDEGYKFDKLGSYACDEAFSIMVSDYTSLDFVQGNITPTNLRSFNIWNSMYIIVRKVNTILKNIDKARDLNGQEKDELMGYLYFMRAYAYYRLIMYYGPIVILGDDVLETNETADYYDRPRATFDESVDYVCGELERSADLMPVEITPSFFWTSFCRVCTGTECPSAVNSGKSALEWRIGCSQNVRNVEKIN